MKLIIYNILFIVFYILSFSPFNLFFLAPVSIYFLIKISLENKKTVTFISITLSQIGILYWISYAISFYGGISPVIASFPTIVLSMYISLYLLIFVIISKKYINNSFFPLFAPSLFVILEYIKSFFMSGFPWMNLGTSTYGFPPLMESVSFGGIYFLSFFIVFIGVIPFAKNKKLWSTVGIISTVILIIYGIIYIKFTDRKIDKISKEIKISVVQGNIDQSIKWSPTFRKSTLDLYFNLTKKSVNQGSKIVFWPETALPFYFQSSILSKNIRKFAKDNKIYILTGSLAFSYSDKKYLNRAYLIAPNGMTLDYYDKHQLVPFGEYLPLEKYLKFIKKIIPMVGGLSAGKKIKNITYPEGKMGVLICYETIFDNISRKMVNLGANFLVNITNDAWFGRTSGPYQHFSMIVFRAIENRRFVVRSANTGISAIISPTGKIIKKLPLGERGYIGGTIKLIKSKTIYTKLGNWIVLLSLFIIIIIILKEKKLLFPKK